MSPSHEPSLYHLHTLSSSRPSPLLPRGGLRGARYSPAWCGRKDHIYTQEDASRPFLLCHHGGLRSADDAVLESKIVPLLFVLLVLLFLILGPPVFLVLVLVLLWMSDTVDRSSGLSSGSSMYLYFSFIQLCYRQHVFFLVLTVPDTFTYCFQTVPFHIQPWSYNQPNIHRPGHLYVFPLNFALYLPTCLLELYVASKKVIDSFISHLLFLFLATHETLGFTIL